MIEIEEKVERLWKLKGKSVRGNLSRIDIRKALAIKNDKKRIKTLFSN